MNSKFKVWVCALLLALLHGCGGGGGGGGAQSGGTGGTGVTVVSSGVMTKGSVIVNGVHYDDKTASIRIDDTPNKQPGDLKDGMFVKVRGQINNDRINGVAQQVEVEHEVRGKVSAKDSNALPPSITAINQKVLVDDLTVFAGFPAPPASPSAAVNAINTTTDRVEVHGLRDAAGNIRASRVELNPAAGTDDLHGAIKAPLTGTTFTLQNGATDVAVTYSVPMISPAGATLAVGANVEVHGAFNGATFVATRVDVEDVEDEQFKPNANDEFEVEGLIAGFNGHPGTFSVAGTQVTTTGSTSFKGGIATDLANDVKVEAEGAWDGSSLVASKIEFKRSVVRLQGLPSVPSGRTFTLRISSVPLVVTIETPDLVGLPTGAEPCVEVRGQRKQVSGSVVTATEIKLTCSGSGSGDHLIQAPVEAKGASSLTLLGLPPIDVSGASSYTDSNSGLFASMQAFLAAITPANPGPPPVAGTLVKLKFTTPGTTVKEAEIED